MEIDRRQFDGRGSGSCVVRDDYGREWRVVLESPGMPTQNADDFSVEVAGHLVVSAGAGTNLDERLNKALRYICSHPGPAE